MGTRGWEQMTVRVRRATRWALQEIGRRLVADIRDSIGTPVHYVPGFGYDRSEPGEPPYREFSDLWKSIKYKVEAKAATVESLSVYTAYVVALYLEFGTRNMEPRPFWEPARRRAKGLKSLLKQLVAERLRSGDQGE